MKYTLAALIFTLLISALSTVAVITCENTNCCIHVEEGVGVEPSPAPLERHKDSSGELLLYARGITVNLFGCSDSQTRGSYRTFEANDQCEKVSSASGRLHVSSTEPLQIRGTSA